MPNASKKRRWVAAILIPVFLAGAYVVNLSIQKGNFNMASLNPFLTTEIVDCNFEPREEVQTKVIAEEPSLQSRVAKSSGQQIQFVVSEESQAKPLTIVWPQEIEEQVIEDPTPAKLDDSRYTNNTNSVLEDYAAQGWFVVGGAFKEYPNAQKLVKQLRSKGHNSFIFGKSGSLHLVCIERYESHADAKTGLTEIKSQGTTAAWIKRK